MPPIAETAPTSPKALMTLGDEQINVRLDAGGYLSRVQRRVKLYYGPHLYAACKPGNEKSDEKVTPYQPGYMLLVEAMGGMLTCPPVSRDHEGTCRPNPLLTIDPASGVCYRAEATAICLLRHPLTGKVIPSVGVAIVDCRLTLMQGLLKIQRDELVRLVPDDEVKDLRAGECKGWGSLPLGTGIAVLYNLRNQGVREVVQDYLHLTGTIRQRASSKAERLAADHNPLLRGRCSWRFDQLRSEGVRRYIEFSTVSWVEKADALDRGAVADLMDSLAAQAAGVAEVVVGESVDVDLAQDPDAPSYEPGESPAQIEQQPDPIPEVVREKVLVEAAAIKGSESTPASMEQPAEIRRPGRASAEVLKKIADLEADMNVNLVGDFRKIANLPENAPINDCSRADVVAYLNMLIKA